MFLPVASWQADDHAPPPPTHFVRLLLAGRVHVYVYKRGPEQGRARPAQQGRRRPGARRGEERLHLRLPDTRPPRGW